jgi:hypothetical protein
MEPDQRIQELCAQLLRSEHSEMAELVAEKLHQEINEFVRARPPRPTTWLAEPSLDAS